MSECKRRGCDGSCGQTMDCETWTREAEAPVREILARRRSLASTFGLSDQQASDLFTQLTLVAIVGATVGERHEDPPPDEGDSFWYNRKATWL